jgi:NADP-dependent alcohol dehydrogenase
MRQITNGIVDAYVHVMEQYLTYPVNSPVQDRFSEGIMLTLIEEGPKAIAAETPDYENRANLMWAATMALNGLIAAGVQSDWATHMIGHELTAFHGLDHAVTLAIVLPGLMKHLKEKRNVKLVQFAERVWDITDGDDNSKIDMAIAKTEEFFNSIDIKTRLGDHNIKQEDVDRIIQRFTDRRVPAIGMAGDVKTDDAKVILEDRL